jgi:Domain of unknown function (DUF4372)/Transposase DDE domain
MNAGRMVFPQVMELLPLHEFRKCVRRYRGDYRARKFSCMDQFLCMAFAQLTYRESLRDIEACLGAASTKLYHLGLRARITRSTLAEANEKRDWRIYADFARVLISTAQEMYAGESWGRNLKRTVYALDSTTIDLCLSLFPWAKFKRTKGAVKVHTLLNVQSHIPNFIRITHGKVHDVNILDDLVFEAGSVYVMDRAYLDYARLHRLHRSGAFFVTRPKKSYRFKRMRSHPVDKTTGVLSDHTVKLVSFYPAQNYPGHLRKIRYFDAERKKRLTFLTNNFTWAATTIALLYKSRWQVELFFKWIKQHLRIKAFYGTSENAVKTQIWISISVYVLVAIFKKQTALDLSLHSILQVLSVNLFEKVPLQQLFTDYGCRQNEDRSHNSLTLLDL